MGDLIKMLRENGVKIKIAKADIEKTISLIANYTGPMSAWTESYDGKNLYIYKGRMSGDVSQKGNKWEAKVFYTEDHVTPFTRGDVTWHDVDTEYFPTSEEAMLFVENTIRARWDEYGRFDTKAKNSR